MIMNRTGLEKERVHFLWLLFLVFNISICAQCKWNNSDSQGNETTLQADTASENEEFESEAKAYESADRVIWQKPDLVIDQLGNVNGKVVADLGAGTGYFSRRIAYKGAKVIAIDIDPQAIQWMQAQKSRFPIELQERLVIRQADPDRG